MPDPSALLSSPDGIFFVEIDPLAGRFREPRLVSDRPSRWLAWGPDQLCLYASGFGDRPGGGKEGRLAAFHGDPATEELRFLNDAPSEGLSACYLAVSPDGRFLFGVNYNEPDPPRQGSFIAYHLLPDGSIGGKIARFKHDGSGPNAGRQAVSHCHSCPVSPSSESVAVGDLGIDRVVLYRILPENPFLERFVDAATPPGSGPRHVVFSADGKFLYTANELGNSTSVIRFQAGSGEALLLQTLSTLPEDYGEKSSVADLHLHPGGRFLYVSNRGHDSIACFAVDPATGTLASRGTVPTDGRTPRGFAVSPDGNWMIVANLDDNEARLFRIDPENGLPKSTGSSFPIPKSECVLFV